MLGTFEELTFEFGEVIESICPSFPGYYLIFPSFLVLGLLAVVPKSSWSFNSMLDFVAHSNFADGICFFLKHAGYSLL